MAQENEKELVLGIDFGTSNSTGSVVIDKEVISIESDQVASNTGKSVPSCVFIHPETKQVLVGQAAKKQALIYPDNTIFHVKRSLSTNKVYTINGTEYRPEQIAAYILMKIKADAEKQLERKFTKAVITIPANYNNSQREATELAAKIAGLEVLSLVHEPTAAALAYDLTKSENEKILVFDLGGGTFDVSILGYSKDPSDNISVLDVIGTGGDTKLGGTDMDQKLVDWTLTKFEKEHNLNLRSDPLVLEKVRIACEDAKINLSDGFETQITIPFITYKNQMPLSVNYTLTRTELNTMLKPLVDRLKVGIDSAIQSAQISKAEITKLLLVGGPCHMPLIKEFAQNYVGIKASTGLSVSKCVAIGAAKKGAILAGNYEGILLLDVTPLSLGVEVAGELMSTIIKKNSKIPITLKETYTTYEDNQTEVVIKILQGERAKSTDNFVLGMFTLQNIPKMKKQEPKIEVTFELNSNGILAVTAKETTTNISQKIVVQKNALDIKTEEIERMVSEARTYEKADSDYKVKVETIHTAKKMIESVNDLKDKKIIKEDDLSNIVELSDNLDKYLANKFEEIDIAQLKTLLKDLEDALNKQLTEMNKQVPSATSEAPSNTSDTSTDKSEQTSTDYDISPTEQGSNDQ